MSREPVDFQVFVKPVGPRCNLSCRYCYYRVHPQLYPQGSLAGMTEALLEAYIAQHLEASAEETVRFSWHGGEPALAGLAFFRRAVSLQKKYRRTHQQVANGLQTNGILLDEEWCLFLAREGFRVGLSMDGPQEVHDLFRCSAVGGGSHAAAVAAYHRLRRHRVPTDILCVVHSRNVTFPLEVYRFFRRLEAAYISFLPLVEPDPGSQGGVSPRTVPAEAWGRFLCTVFDEWKQQDIGRIKVQIFEEATRTAFGQEHSLCLFRPECGSIPTVEHNGDFYCCDHFMDPGHRIGNILQAPLAELLQAPRQKAFGQAKRNSLPRCCLGCEVRTMCHGECPKNRFLPAPDGGEIGWNYLCPGYRRFFNHCRPFVAEVAAVWRRQTALQAAARAGVADVSSPPPGTAPGRNDPCPCGSGRKYKKCCLPGQA